MLVVDHHDSYTWNLVHLIAAVTGVLPDVVEHDEPGVLDRATNYTHLVLSPGPGHPANPADFARRTEESTQRFAGVIRAAGIRQAGG